ncbi:hypothetical protein GVN20_08200 [Runella sp. CRIBMP]|uniref:hypothetical protein n=1 Tax=Runella sp. CRIBMP TaxID=2683261 RepID=UPI00141289EE|nr:hypothetical protein [Runella sp. CRIBMP]NBB19330.1 hypothetical protein [Runella sp. CRIBMP]
MVNYQRNGRALQLEGLENARNKVTLGFKCDAGTKIQLAQEANQNAMTLSEYVETVVSLRHQRTNHAPQKSSYTFNEWESKINNAKKQTEQVQTQLDFYEKNPLLLELFKSHKGQSVSYLNVQGQKQSIVINQIADVFTVLIHSFNPQKP